MSACDPAQCENVKTSSLLRQCNLDILQKKSTDTQMEVNKLYCCKGIITDLPISLVLRVSIISPRSSILVTRLFPPGACLLQCLSVNDVYCSHFS